MLEELIKFLEKLENVNIKKNIKYISNLKFAEMLLDLDKRDLARRAAGNVSSLVLIDALVKLYKNEKIKLPKNDYDIKHMVDNLRSNTKKIGVKKFLNKNYTYVGIADRTRNRSTHYYEKCPTKSDIEQLIDFSREVCTKFNIK